MDVTSHAASLFIDLIYNIKFESVKKKIKKKSKIEEVKKIVNS